MVQETSLSMIGLASTDSKKMSSRPRILGRKSYPTVHLPEGKLFQ